MLLHRAFAPEYLAATVGGQSTHQPILVHWQLMDGLDHLAGHLQLACILDQTGPTANFFCYDFGLLPLREMGALHMALDLAGQNAVSALFAHCQRVLDQMRKMLACDVALCHGGTTVIMTIQAHDMA
jgi:hypothetical protein